MASAPAKQRVRLSDQVGEHHAIRRVRMRGRYDAAQTTDENRRTWSAADGFSPDEANSLGVRTILRNRARYVAANNPRARGMLATLANHTVGPGGPRLQMLLGAGTVARRLNQRIEGAFTKWAREIGLAKKLRIMRRAKVHTGEVFAVKVINPALRGPIKLDLQIIEADQVTSPFGRALYEREVDGIRFDELGNRSSYTVLKYHPGDLFRGATPGASEDLSANVVHHYYVDEDRPNVHRGVPEIASAVQVFEEGRRFRAAVLAASETAADFAMAIQTDAAADGGAAALVPMDTFEMQRRMATTLPEGWKLVQTKAEQPTTTFREFSRELLSEIARCINMPLTIAALDSSQSNMSSAYLDYQPYASAIGVERDDLECLLEDLLDTWLTFALDPAAGILGRRPPREYPHAWFWTLIGRHADPNKLAGAQQTRLRNHLTTLSAEYAEMGMDWEDALRQRAREKALMLELGLSDTEAAPAVNTGGMPQAQQPKGGNPNDEEDDAEEDEVEDGA